MSTQAITKAPAALCGALARELLRRLRDVNLEHRNLRADRGTMVSIGGCLSLDEPVEEDLRYRLAIEGAGEHVLRIGWAGGLLRLELARHATGEARTRLEVPLLLGCDGRATVPACRARIDPETPDRRAVEHFLRRVVRSAVVVQGAGVA
jgi:hypothetical protein